MLPAIAALPRHPRGATPQPCATCGNFPDGKQLVLFTLHGFPFTIKAQHAMSIIVDLYEFLVERGTPKKKAGGVADARRPAQSLVIKEGALAKRLIEEHRHSPASTVGKDRRGVKQ